MRSLLILLTLFTINAHSQFYRFEFWKTLTRPEKEVFFLGWANGFGMGREGVSEPFIACVESVTVEQAVAMIDKRFKDNPAKWSSPIAVEIFNLFIDENGPCPAFAKLYRPVKAMPNGRQRPER